MKIFYLRDKHSVPVACVASEKSYLVDVSRPMSQITTETVNFAVSTRNPLDELSKKMGRHIAQERLQIGKHETVTRSRHVKRDIVTFIADPSNKYPKRAQRAAQLWLNQHLIT